MGTVQYNGERWRSDGEMMTRFEFWTTVVLVMPIRNCHVLEPPRAFFMSIQFIGCMYCMDVRCCGYPIRPYDQTPNTEYGIRERGVNEASLLTACTDSYS